MPHKSAHPVGTPSWAELASPDPEASRRFYGELFGWAADVSPDPAAAGASSFLLGGRRVAGLAPLLAENQAPAWTTYIAVDDVDHTVRAAVKAGATVILPPDQVADVGRTAILSSPQGARFSLWQPKDGHPGAEVVDEPGAMCWNELSTHDHGTARRFYGAVFGWEARTEHPDGATYTAWTHHGHRVAGLVLMDRGWPADVPADWMVYFAVADCDEAAARAVELGGSVSVGPTDMPGVGRSAVVNDLHGAVFAMATPAPRHT